MKFSNQLIITNELNKLLSEINTYSEDDYKLVVLAQRDVGRVEPRLEQQQQQRAKELIQQVQKKSGYVDQVDNYLRYSLEPAEWLVSYSKRLEFSKNIVANQSVDLDSVVAAFKLSPIVAESPVLTTAMEVLAKDRKDFEFLLEVIVCPYKKLDEADQKRYDDLMTKIRQHVGPENLAPIDGVHFFKANSNQAANGVSDNQSNIQPSPIIDLEEFAFDQVTYNAGKDD